MNINGLNATASIDDATGDIIIKIANLNQYSQTVSFELPGGLTGAGKTTLHSDNAMDENTLDEPERIVPQTSEVDLTPVSDPSNDWLMGVRNLESGRIELRENFPARTFAVYRFHTK